MVLPNQTMLTSKMWHLKIKLVSTIADQTLTEQQREQQLAWQQAPAAALITPEKNTCYRYMYAMVLLCSSPEVFELNIANKLASMYLWQ